MKIIGITGNTGAGKSTATALLREAGAFIIDADKIGHEIILKGNTAYNEIVKVFGTDILNAQGDIDRKKLGYIVFADKEQLKKLSAITHPRITRHIMETIETVRNKRRIIVIDAPLLFQAGLDDICDLIYLITASPDIRAKRIAVRDNLTMDDAKKRIEIQENIIDLLNKNQLAKTIIINNNSYINVLKQLIFEGL
ncbi:MAG: dephospho-CoA kinase [Clostridiales bacterium]|nr:dephospho-CoA kinase [Clostridiales bacterium]